MFWYLMGILRLAGSSIHGIKSLSVDSTHGVHGLLLPDLDRDPLSELDRDCVLDKVKLQPSASRNGHREAVRESLASVSQQRN